jgi:hypothetical protein
MTPTNIINNDPLQDNFTDALRQFEEAQQRMMFAQQFLSGLLAKMIELAKSGKTAQAFQMAQNQVLPSVMEVKGNGLGGLAGSMNVTSALQKFTAEVQKEMNAIANEKDDQKRLKMATDFVNALKQYYKDIQDLKPPLMNGDTQSNLLQAFSKICNVFPTASGGHTPDDLDPAIVSKWISYWVANPTSDTDPYNNKNPGGKTNQQLLQDLQAGITTLNNTVSAQSQGLQAKVQFETNSLSQFMGTLSAIYKAASDGLRAFNKIAN